MRCNKDLAKEKNIDHLIEMVNSISIEKGLDFIN
jgi:hypothetical protein